MCEIQRARPSVAPYAAVLDDWSDVDQIQQIRPSAAPQSLSNRMFIHQHASPSNTPSFFHLTGHCWRFVCVRAGKNVCSCVTRQLWELLAFSSVCPVFEADFTSPWFTGCWYTIRTAVRAKGDARLLPVVSPAGKWCDTCRGPQSYIKEQPFRVWGTRGSCLPLIAQEQRKLSVCVCFFFWGGGR